MTTKHRNLRLATRNGVPQPDREALAFEGMIFQHLDSLSRAEASQALREMGAQVPANPSATDFAAAWAEIQPKLAGQYRFGKFLDEKSGTKDREAQLAWVREVLAAPAEVARLKEETAKLELGLEGRQLESAIATAKKDGKLTPAIETSVREQFAAKDITLKGAVAWLSNLVPVTALGAGRGQTGPGTDGLTWNGKTYADLKPAQRAQLKKEAPELFLQMSTAAATLRRRPPP